MRPTAVVLIALVAFLSYRLAAVENQRYALSVGMCPGRLGLNLPDLECLSQVQSRTHWLWHLYHGLKG